MNEDYIIALLQKMKSGSGFLGGAQRFDYMGFTHTSGNLTQIVYKTGGASGTTVATLDLAYTGDEIASITKT